MDKELKITENLATFGITDDIKSSVMKYLIKIDEVLESITKTQSDSIQKIKNNKISINKVALESGIARQTFYNNPIITLYIEKYIALKTDSSPFETIDFLRAEIRKKDEMISNLVQRDANVSKCKAENQELIEEIVSLQETIKSQEELIRELRSPNIFPVYN